MLQLKLETAYTLLDVNKNHTLVNTSGYQLTFNKQRIYARKGITPFFCG